MVITANELKTRGVAAIDAALKEQEEIIISVRGKEKFVVMDLATYNRFRNYELEVALNQTRKELAAGLGVEESVEEHLARLKASE